MSIEDLILRVWRHGAPERVIFQAGGHGEEHRVRRAAETAALEEDALVSWPIDYRVLGADGRLWSVRVDRVTQPSYVAVAAAELPLPPATHVLWHGKVVCDDVRLNHVAPSRWPKGHRWMSLAEFVEGKMPDDRCEACWKRAPVIAEKALT